MMRVLLGDVRESLAQIPERSTQTCVTSPPYWGLRDYGVDGQIGLEATPDEYVATMVDVFRGVWRVLKDNGTLWLNLGDSYFGDSPPRSSSSDSFSKTWDPSLSRGAGGSRRSAAAIGSLRPKNLVGIPWRVALALQSDGWYLRSDIIWHKPNPMPEPAKDRPTKSHEYIFLLTKQPDYYYNAKAIEEQGAEPDRVRINDAFGGKNGATVRHGAQSVVNGKITTRNKRDVWTVNLQPYPGAHFATFPEKLIEPCILAGSREGDTALDPFTGSGTTGVVAVAPKFRWLRIESRISRHGAAAHRGRATEDVYMNHKIGKQVNPGMPTLLTVVDDKGGRMIKTGPSSYCVECTEDHMCGLQGYNPCLGDTCPSCDQARVLRELMRKAEET